MKNFTVIIRCNAGYEPGYGHINRCLSLAKAFKVLGVTSINFLLNSGEAADLAQGEGYAVYILGGCDLDAAFLATVQELKPDILVLDVRPPHSLAVLQIIKDHVHCLVLLDDVSEQRFAADLLYLPPVFAVERADWSDIAGQKRVGLQWMLTGLSFVQPPYRKPEPPLRLLMTMGGSDPWGYTQRLTPVIADICLEDGIIFGVVIGPSFQKREQQIAALSRLPGSVRIFDAPANMGEAYGWCDAAIISMSVSAYELARSAKPALYICPDADYEEHARALVREGFGEILPLSAQENDVHQKNNILYFLRSFTNWESMTARADIIFHGDPATKMAEDILRFLKHAQ